ncbi:MAG: adenylosuccinate synthase [Sorangiineae bacterium NIC37A_2]|jgi:adenylosuccinate synthase|nr:MAG: adenylosuccinate synthase [Sorangiineae bacterium NIC37A_2]
MSAVVVVGAQWGDEGKGKIVDIYTEHADFVVRYAGGPNAGHTLVVGSEKLVVRLLPSGILRPSTRCILGQGMVVDPAVLVGEIDELIRRGQTDVEKRLLLSDRAHIILPYHIEIDSLRESSAPRDRAIGTTKKGIGPCYEDKVRRTGIRAGDLRDLAALEAKIESTLGQWRATMEALGGTTPSAREIVEQVRPFAERLVPLLGNASKATDDAIRAGKRVMLEGAQGTLLDVDHGTYPYVTSSSAVSGGAAIGAGIGPNRIDTVLGIVKAYTTRVGEGPFPTELKDGTGEHLRNVGDEYGSVTRRPRRTGWLDLPGLRYAARVNGIDGLALTKLDVLTGLDTIQVCVAYDTPYGRTTDLPIDLLTTPGLVEPVYRSFPGWSENLENVRSLDELPETVRSYVDFIAEEVGVPMYLVSVGPSRDATIVLKSPYAERA